MMEWWAIWPSAHWVTLLLGFGVLALGAYVARRAFDAGQSNSEIARLWCGTCRCYHTHILSVNAKPCGREAN